MRFKPHCQKLHVVSSCTYVRTILHHFCWPEETPPTRPSTTESGRGAGGLRYWRYYNNVVSGTRLLHFVPYGMMMLMTWLPGQLAVQLATKMLGPIWLEPKIRCTHLLASALRKALSFRTECISETRVLMVGQCRCVALLDLRLGVAGCHPKPLIF